MKARDLDRKFDEGEDVSADLDLSNVRRLALEQRLFKSTFLPG